MPIIVNDIFFYIFYNREGQRSEEKITYKDIYLGV